MTISLSILLASTGLAAPGAQQKGGGASETVATVVERDLNGAAQVIEKVVTRRSPTRDGEEVVIETYLPSIDAGRLALSQRVRRLTTVTAGGSETVEETEQSSLSSSHEPMRVVRRSVTTIRRYGPEASVTERRVFERDLAGRLVPVPTQVEPASRR